MTLVSWVLTDSTQGVVDPLKTSSSFAYTQDSRTSSAFLLTVPETRKPGSGVTMSIVGEGRCSSSIPGSTGSKTTISHIGLYQGYVEFERRVDECVMQIRTLIVPRIGALFWYKIKGACCFTRTKDCSFRAFWKTRVGM